MDLVLKEGARTISLFYYFSFPAVTYFQNDIVCSLASAPFPQLYSFLGGILFILYPLQPP